MFKFFKKVFQDIKDFDERAEKLDKIITSSINYYRFYNIPRRIHIFGHNIDILFDENLANNDGKTGVSNFRKGIITIQPSCIQMNRTYDSVQRTYYHEVFHFILALLDYSDLTFDEHFVELVAGGIHQVISTAEY